MKQETSLSVHAKQVIMKGFPPKLGAASQRRGRKYAKPPKEVIH